MQGESFLRLLPRYLSIALVGRSPSLAFHYFASCLSPLPCNLGLYFWNIDDTASRIGLASFSIALASLLSIWIDKLFWLYELLKLSWISGLANWVGYLRSSIQAAPHQFPVPSQILLR